MPNKSRTNAILFDVSEIIKVKANLVYISLEKLFVSKISFLNDFFIDLFF